NPNTFKFVLNKTLFRYESASFRNAEEANNNPLSRAIFEVAQSIREVFITENYITVTHDGSENCEGLKNIIRSKILENISFYISQIEQAEITDNIEEETNDLSQNSIDEPFLLPEEHSSEEEPPASTTPEDTPVYKQQETEYREESEVSDLLSPVLKAEAFIKENLEVEPTPTEERDITEVIPDHLNIETIDKEINKIETESINTIIDELIRPALQRDGGDLRIIDYRDNVLTISYKGSCITCPHAEEGTLHAMQNILKEKFNQDIVVRIVKSENEAELDDYYAQYEQEEQLELAIEKNALPESQENITSVETDMEEEINNIKIENENFDTEKQC
ncbi:MAG: NifU family protein, partial [Candidatus Omnitrophica bacterium]|nr:NifU family protein [Candidatus Omnitrophota bacterium]MBU1997444.1 NifU family protein [Candidatus Omnitrophota bacterium]